MQGLLRRRLTYANVVATVASGDIADGGLRARDFARGELPTPFGGDFAVESVSYAAALPSRPTPHTVMHGATPPPECPGTAAAPGHLCLYERPNFAPNRNYVAAGNAAEGRLGFVIEMGAKTAGPLNSFGSWAVTAP